MPCQADPSEVAALYAADRLKERKDRAAVRQRLDRLTSMLCAVMRSVEASRAPIAIPADVADWWARHKQEDAAREGRTERADASRRQAELAAKKTKADRAAAIKKLTPNERQALGL